MGTISVSRAIAVIGILLATHGGTASGAQAMDSQANLPLAQGNPISVVFNNSTPPDVGTPSGRQRGGASRGPCRNYEALTALVPTVGDTVWGLTASDHPTFWFSLPTTLTPETAVEFTLQDEFNTPVYTTRFTAPGAQAGLIQIAVPLTAQPLTVNQTYSWALAIYCDPARPFASVSVSGTVKRLALPQAPTSQPATAPSLEQAKVYAAEGFWHDALNTLAVLYRSDAGQPQVAAAWADLLRQGGLEAIANQPITPCCQPAHADQP
ncbi:MAG: DUF928 domain-containing protein [Synechococcales bacterium]|nr:DUF928 domain-containing protein [Synechococcales bacterium]